MAAAIASRRPARRSPIHWIRFAVQKRQVGQRDRLQQRSQRVEIGGKLEPPLNTVARLAVPGIADSCASHLIDECGAIRLVAAMHVDPLKAFAIEALADPETAAPSRTCVRTIREGMPALLTDIDQATSSGCGTFGRPEGAGYFRAPSNSI